ncbi:MAG: ribosome hibernation-promoting factor, HPF/YfiA family [Parachlamydiaceae bacterium]
MTRKEKANAFVDEGYNITVTGRHVQVTEPMKDYAIEKISKLERLSPRLIDVDVTMDIQKLDHRVDIRMQFNHLKIKSHASGPDMYASIDKAVDRLETQLMKHKDRIQDHHAKGVSMIDMNVNIVGQHKNDETMLVNDEIDEQNMNDLVNRYSPHKVKATKKRPLKTLTLDEAIFEFELSGDEFQFLVFRSEEDKKLKVLYRTKDGNYGVLEPEA